MEKPSELDLRALTMSKLTKPYDDVQITLKYTSEDLLRRLKTYLAKTAVDHGSERSSSIALIHCNYSMNINYDEVIARLYALNTPRVCMEDLLKN